MASPFLEIQDQVEGRAPSLELSVFRARTPDLELLPLLLNRMTLCVATVLCFAIDTVDRCINSSIMFLRKNKKLQEDQASLGAG